MSFTMICSSVLLSPVNAATLDENNMFEFDLSNMNVGDVYIEYQDLDNNSRYLRIIIPQSTPTIDALAEMTWLQINSVSGTSAEAFSAYLGCYVSYRPNRYKVY